MNNVAFDAYAAQYDAWYDSDVGRPIFATEVACLRPFLHRYPMPHLEIGVGSGRFAQALAIEDGVDPAAAPLKLARARGVRGAIAAGENLPFPDGVFGEVLIALALCFVTQPALVLEESRRVLRPEGGLVLGLILGESPWAEYYARKGREGHPIYSQARFFAKNEMEALLRFCRFEALEYRSCLFQPPGLTRYLREEPVSGYHPPAGFVALSAHVARAGGMHRVKGRAG
ncbi:MAG: class I SAM-dependent methyltransferase [Dehalococcoidia bacterium]|nr:class I SAM-dependent methyltransferase [Dehalococcoidia bacterium]